MDILKITRLFMLYTGFDEKVAAEFAPVIEMARDKLTARLARQPSPGLQTSLAEAAVAASAYYDYRLLAAASEAGSFTAGDISVSSDTKLQLEAAKALRWSALGAISELLCDDPDFVFMRTNP